jgi:hypothetical protein
MRGAGRIPQPEVVKAGPRRVEAELAALAARQYGVVATRQLVALGWSQQAIAKRPRSGGCTGSTAASMPSVIVSSRRTDAGWPRSSPAAPKRS